MSRDQRVQDNWAFLYAQKLALQLEVPLHVCFCLVPKFLDATIRHFRFMLKGLREVEQECQSQGISFHLLTGYASEVLPKFVRDHNIGGVVTDFSPLRGPRKWVEDVREVLPDDVPLCQVDAHNIVPCWIASPKLEYGARTIRKKIHEQLPLFLTEFPPIIKHKYLPKSKPEPTDWDAADASLEVDMTVGEVDWANPGTKSALLELDEFCKKRLKFFAAERNNPNKAVASNLSPWIHFGQISVQRCILIVKQFKGKFKESVDSYIEEAIIRRELSDNFCYYNKNYDSIEGAYDWAKTSLQIHAKDKREKIYTQKQFEEAKTHDDLWNAAQIQLVREGKMHGFLRMYWAKKILEWTPSPEEALRIAIYLNDRFSLDGRDPNGFVGCAWSICGIHDQGWAERAVFGKIRYMNYKGCQRKFKVDEFVKKYGAKKY
ncbi:deoxyribodipyrimidine photo-lyase-like isoform X2 [Lineus longissimus]